jgi:adenine-specific DNA methylase
MKLWHTTKSTKISQTTRMCCVEPDQQLLCVAVVVSYFKSIDLNIKLLELFSGTGSVGKVAKELGFDVVSSGLKDANINTDILRWNYKVFKQNEFNIIGLLCLVWNIALPKPLVLEK